MSETPKNLYVHFPFCRRKCAYCALHSRAGQSERTKKAYVACLAREIRAHLATGGAPFETVYFGGGSPALCDLRPLFDALDSAARPPKEFTVELHPLDVTRETLQALKAGGVNRVSMGLQSLDDDILSAMGRGHTFADAERAFMLIKEFFANAGVDLIVGYPGETRALSPRHARLAKWGLAHCSVYSLILEEKSLLAHELKSGRVQALPDDDTVMNRLAIVARFLEDLGLTRYEISNFSLPGRECAHNLATWRGEDYLGLGEGASGRIGLSRTRGVRGADGKILYETETVTPAEDKKERAIFQLRTREGLSIEDFPAWESILEKHVADGLLAKLSDSPRYRLTERGTEVCDTILADLV